MKTSNMNTSREVLDGRESLDRDVINHLIAENLNQGIGAVNCCKILKVWYKVIEPYNGWLTQRINAIYHDPAYRDAV